MHARMAQAWLRYSRWDALLVGAAFLCGTVLLLFPSVVTIGLGIWWIGNTASHNFIHRPFFRGRAWNRLFSIYLTLLLGMPQRLWRDRHLAHHADVPWRARWSKQLSVESMVLCVVWVMIV